MNILQLLMETKLPFTLVEHPGFRKIINKVDPKVTVKSANTFAQQKLPLMTRTIKDTMNQVLERNFQQCTAVAITSDHWTSRTGASYMPITMHYVKPDFTLKNFIIQLDQFDGRHTGIIIAQACDKKLHSISALKNIPRVTTAFVDQASNMRLALTLSKRVKTLDEGSMQCIDQKLNTALQMSSEANEIFNKAFTRARNLARRVHQSEDEFEYFKSLSNMLKQVKDCSDFLSSKKSIRMDNTLYHVKLLVQGCKNMVHSYPVESYPVIGSF